MSPFRYVRAIGVLALLAALSGWNASAQGNDDGWNENSREVKHVFVIAWKITTGLSRLLCPARLRQFFRTRTLRSLIAW